MKKKNIIITITCSLLVSAVFCIRWHNCLPFSGNMPVLKDFDNITMFGRYMIYAKESFDFPIGLIKNLGFPFEVANISRSIPLFAIPLKVLSKILPSVAEFYYSVLFEIVAVFITGIITCQIFEEFNVKDFLGKLFGTALIALSCPLLFRSSVYYGISFEVGYFPIYLATGLLYIKFYKNPTWKKINFFVLIFSIAALTDYYVLFGISFVLLVAICMHLIEVVNNMDKKNRVRSKLMIIGLLTGLGLSLITLSLMGDQQNLEVPSEINPYAGRYSNTGWSYGGGFGGGFHVADVLSVFIPSSSQGPKERIYGPDLLLAKAGFPVTTSDLQRGQYEGFTFLGSVTIFLLLIVIIYMSVSFLRKFKLHINKTKFLIYSKLSIGQNLFSQNTILFISVFSLYIMSWGYILHIAGVRFNNIITPSLLVAEIWPNFMFARSLGRLAIPFMLFFNIAIIITFLKIGYRVCNNFQYRKIIFSFILVGLITLHCFDIKGYLQTNDVVYGNDITNRFSVQDKINIKKLLSDKKVLLTVPTLQSSNDWSKVCYSLAFFSEIPITGATSTLGGASLEQKRQYDKDIDEIVKGNIGNIQKKYGNIAIAAPPDVANHILQKTDTQLKYNILQNQDVILLTLVNK